MKKIKINGKEYKFKNTLRSMFIFEQITNKPFRIETMLDNYIYLYSIILANNNDDLLKWDDFINALDEDLSIYNQLMEILSENRQIDELIDGSGDKDNSVDEKKN